ncbi:YybH family protein [Streptomyces sp. NPDC055287]
MTATTTDLSNLVLTDDVEQQNQAFIDAFNSGDGSIFDQLYRDDAISNLSGSPLTGAERRQGIIDLLKTGPTLDSKVLHNYVAGDVSLVIVEFHLEVTDEEGSRQKISGTCTDVMRRTGDNRWIMAIDRPLADELPTK